MSSIADSVIREVGEVKEGLLRMNTRLDKIAAGSHYVSRLERRLDIRPEGQ